MTAFCRGRIELAVKQQIASIIYEEGKSFKLVSPRYKDRISTMTVGYLLSPFWSPYSTE